MSKPQAILLVALQRNNSDLLNFLHFFNTKPTLLIPLVFLDQPTKNLLDSAGIPYKALAASKGQAEQLESFSQEVKELDFSQLETKPYETLVKNYLTANLPLSLELLDALAEAKEEFEILGALVSNEAFQRERLVRDWCNAHQVPTLHFNHGASYGAVGGAYANFATQAFALTNPNEIKLRTAATAKQANPPKLVVTGMGSWDKYALIKNTENEAAFKASLGMQPEQKLVTFFPTISNTSYVAGKQNNNPQIEGILSFLTAVAELAPKHPEVVFVIKDRPSNDSFVEALVVSEAKKLKINPQQLLYKYDYAEPYVAFSYLTLATRSTIACESLICQVPHLNYVNNPADQLVFEPETAVPPVFASELAATLQHLLTKNEAYTQLKTQQAASQLLTGEAKDFCSSIRGAKLIAQVFNQPAIEEKLKTSLSAWHSYQQSNVQVSFAEQLEDPNNPLSYHWHNVSLLLKFDQRFAQASSYNRWLASKVTPAVEGQLMGERMQSWQQRPTFHLIYPVFANEFDGLADSLDALDSQMYKHFGVSLLSPSACPSPDLLTQSNLQWVETPDPFSQLNQVIEEVESDWVLLLMPGDQLMPDALFNLAEYANLNPDWLAIYADEDSYYIDAEGEQIRQEPNFKPAFNYELLLSTNYVGRCVALRRDALQALGGLTNLPYMQNEDLLLRLGTRMTLPAIGHLPFIANTRSSLQDEVFNSQALEVAGAEVRLNHLKERSLTDVELLPGLKPLTWQAKFPLPNPAPKVAVLLPVMNAHEGMFAGISSLVEKTSYPNWQLYLGLPENLIQAFSQEYIEEHQLKVIQLNTNSRATALTQLAEAAKDASFYCFAEADLHSVQENWLEALVRQGLKPEVGLVAPRLVKPNGKIFGVGQVLGLNGSVSDLYADFHLEQDLINQPRAWCDQNFSALNSSCVLVSKENFTKFGLTPEFANSFYLADLGLRMQQQGLRLHFTPYATLASQGFTQHRKQLAQQQELTVFYQQWFNFLLYDPMHNINLQLKASGNEPDTKFNYNWHPVFHQQPRVLLLPLHVNNHSLSLIGNLGYYLSQLEEQEVIRSATCSVDVFAKAKDLPHLVELARINADLIICVGEEPEGYQGKLAQLKELTGVKLAVYTNLSLSETAWQPQLASLDLVLASQASNEFNQLSHHKLLLPLAEEVEKEQLKQGVSQLKEVLTQLFLKKVKKD